MSEFNRCTKYDNKKKIDSDSDISPCDQINSQIYINKIENSGRYLSESEREAKLKKEMKLIEEANKIDIEFNWSKKIK